MARLLNVIVEVALRENEKQNIRNAIMRVNDALLNLVQNKKNQSFSIDGNRIDAIHCDGIYGEIDKPCIVPDFGHDFECKCEHTEPFGVLRLFGVNSFVIDGYPDSSQIFGTYELTSDIRLVVYASWGCNFKDSPTIPLKKLS